MALSVFSLALEVQPQHLFSSSFRRLDLITLTCPNQSRYRVNLPFSNIALITVSTEAVLRLSIQHLNLLA